jgi:uncharacterized membrane protein YeaQ/YmgE (transglycosylase-associated protein family)
MAPTIGELVVWLVVGALAGSVTGMLVKRQREGFGRLRNLGVGLSGALIGGLLFKLFRIDLGLADVSISLEDLIAALVGSLLLLGVVRLIRRAKERRSGAD